MKKLAIILLIGLAIASCQQKKEEPVPQSQFPSGPIQARDDTKILKDALKSDPKNVEGWIKLGNIMMDTSRFNEAIDAYQRALELDPKNVDVRVDLGTCYRNSGRPDFAAREYRKALELNPNHVNGYRNLGVVLAFDLKDTAGAIQAFEKYIQLAPNAPDRATIQEEVQRMKSKR